MRLLLYIRKFRQLASASRDGIKDKDFEQDPG